MYFLSPILNQGVMINKAWINNKLQLIFSDKINLRQFFSSKYAYGLNDKQFKSQKSLYIDFYALWIISEISTTSGQFVLTLDWVFDLDYLSTNPRNFHSTVTIFRLLMIFGTSWNRWVSYYQYLCLLYSFPQTQFKFSLWLERIYCLHFQNSYFYYLTRI